MNALKLGIFARSALLPGEDPKTLARLHREMTAQYQPQSPGESQILDEICAVKWRLLRFAKTETGLFHMYRHVEGKIGNEAQAFAFDIKNLGVIPKLPVIEAGLERKLTSLLKRLAVLQSDRKPNATPAATHLTGEPAVTSPGGRNPC